MGMGEGKEECCVCDKRKAGVVAEEATGNWGAKGQSCLWH